MRLEHQRSWCGKGHKDPHAAVARERWQRVAPVEAVVRL
jgi:hypothetical protein